MSTAYGTDGGREPSGGRTLIVGGGVVGLLTAVECVRAGQHTTVIERGPLPNTRCSSHDRHRVMRALHPHEPGATRAAVAAHLLWRELESLLEARLLHSTGVLTVLPTADSAHAAAELTRAGARARTLDPAQLAGQYRHLAFPPGLGAVLEDDMGVLLADRVLTAAVRWLDRRPRARLRPYTTVTRVDPAARSVTLEGGRVLRGDRVLLAAGAWSAGLLPPALAGRLVVHRQTMVYCALPPQQREQWRTTPAVPALGTAWGAWLVPPVDDTPLKLSADAFCRVVDEPGGPEPDPADAEALALRFTDLIPGLRPDWVVGARECHYTTDGPSGGALLADLGEGAVLAHCACGGGAFKFAPLIARTLASRFAGVPPIPTGLHQLDTPTTAARADGPGDDTEIQETTDDRLQRQNVPQHRGGS
ncbi:NAD(P)/FAD-dependent oxidoreductase [Streptomyces sp. HD]|uniref:NAD(P)/FAD-dependent oxidoreductase n=1 Tax=Streptomyces sp. HD TaxID=3020892 RepID=UPI00232D65AF|nr:FAD-dependent oxidoreductase [Streptomyces sp. HD]MDC0773770.1 FAD-dependent oxidoreductase [Streptomyces sp. HD]